MDIVGRIGIIGLARRYECTKLWTLEYVWVGGCETLHT